MIKDLTISAYALPGLKGKTNVLFRNKEDVLENIEATVSNYFGVKANLFGCRTREGNVTMARHITMYFMRSKTKSSLKAIGKRYNRDHTTVINAVRKVRNYMEVDEMTRHIVQKLEGMIQ